MTRFAIGSIKKTQLKPVFLITIEDPCHDCLNEPVNVYSHKPVYYKPEQKEGKY